MPPSLSAPMGRTIYIVPHHSQLKCSQPSILAHRQLKLSPFNRIVSQPLHNIPRTIRPIQRAMPYQPPLTPLKKRKVESSPAPVATPELVDIAEVYQLLGEHFGPDQDDLAYSSIQLAPRKRERLTNLTKEEKLHRRKLKNRVAAQTARDRKKERSQKLERAVRALLQETSRLRTQNAYLQREVENLRSATPVNHNSPDYRHFSPELVLPEGRTETPKVLEVPTERAFGSAESINEPQPRDRALSKSTWNGPEEEITLPSLLPTPSLMTVLLNLFSLAFGRWKSKRWRKTVNWKPSLMTCSAAVTRLPSTTSATRSLKMSSAQLQQKRQKVRRMLQLLMLRTRKRRQLSVPPLKLCQQPNG